MKISHKTQKTITCYIITETSLGIQCAEVLLKKKHQVLGLISRDPQVLHWAHKNNIPLIKSLKDFEESVVQDSFDYLFSVVNHRILSASLLKSPRHYAINYHDAPLPKYAGVNATSWALLNNESMHGVTWHIMNDIVDGGDILKQVRLSIDTNETAVSLNLKCYTYAIESFKVLIEDLEQEKAVEKKQELEHRTYYSLHQKPQNLGFISWNDSAEKIERQWRALHFGTYPNTLTPLKLLIGQGSYQSVFFPSKIDVLKTQSKKAPGTLVKITQDALHVSTTTKDISVSRFQDIEGRVCTTFDLAEQTKVSVGSVFLRITQKALEQLKKIVQEISKHENFWKGELINSVPTQLSLLFPSQKITKDSPHTKAKNDKEYILSEKLLEASDYKKGLGDSLGCKQGSEDNLSYKQESGNQKNPSYKQGLACKIKGKQFSAFEFFITTLLIYLKRTEDETSITIGLENQWYKGRQYSSGLTERFKGLFPKYLPANFTFSLHSKAIDILECVRKQLSLLQEKKGYLKEVLLCDSESQNVRGEHLININFTEQNISTFTGKDIELSDETQVFLTFSKEEGAFTSKVKGKEHKNLFQRFIQHLKNIHHFIIDCPNSSLEDFYFITQEERHQLLIEWNDTQASYEAYENQRIHELFEAQVAKNPHNIALVYEDQSLTYQHLNDKANQLAHHLQSLGVGPDVLVAIAVERSLEMVVGLLSILKAGGAYVPLDPDYPEERLQFMLEDTQASVLMTQSGLKPLFQWYRGEIVELNERRSFETYPKTNLPVDPEV